MNIQALTFALGNEIYGVDILRVREIRSWEPVSRIPNVPYYEKGVINLRGSIVPVIDMRERFGFSVSGYSQFTVVIILQASFDDKERIVGVVVDAVSNVVDIDSEFIQATPDFGSKIDDEFISGLATMHGQLLMLLDVDKLLEFN